MDKQKILEYAAQNIVPDVKLNCAERALYYTTRDIYRGFYKGTITEKAGMFMKDQALKQFALDNSELSQAKEILRHNAAMWQEIEEAGSRYRTDRTLENADAFVEAVYGVGIKNNFLKGGKNNEAENNPPG